MSNEEVDENVADLEKYVDYVEDDDEDLEWLDKRELIQLVQSNPALYAKSSKEYCGKGFDKDLAWQSLGSCLSRPMSGPKASKLFYNIRQRFGKERRQVAASLKGKSGRGAKAPYVSTWPLYEDCLFLADHIVGRKYVFCFMCVVYKYFDKTESHHVLICFPERQVATIFRRLQL
ncbi:uncharacterized protein LOC112461487 isoform X1 [Temnothorax curvispinosus]|uniref:Uncharacterized protein LOC112461487 isoform X1 n=1 Tax=Temnothorax curvispinosus TaxID=300111 RepID=A0A6J1QKT3_9HYME|nr:uncharacterized protein LOC112461487 isoform X1 [Temnothorax curvispinosus]